MKKQSVLFIFLSAMLILFACFCTREEPAGPTENDPPMLNKSVIDLADVKELKFFGDSLARRLRRSSIRYLSSNSLSAVTSVSVGIVDSVVFNTNAHYLDYRIRIRAFPNSLWYIVYNHVAEVKVKVGDKVEAGTILGRVGTGDLVDLQVSKIAYENSGVTHEAAICPTLLFHGTIEQEHALLISRLGITTQICIGGTATPYYSELWR